MTFHERAIAPANDNPSPWQVDADTYRYVRKSISDEITRLIDVLDRLDGDCDFEIDHDREEENEHGCDAGSDL